MRLDALGDVDGDAAHVVAVQFDLAGVKPTRTWMPVAPTASRMAQAQCTARPGPSKVARNPSPVVVISSTEAFEFGAGEAVVSREDL